MFKNLRKEMKAKKVRQQDIAEALNISGVSVYNKINGRTEFTLDEALAIRDKFFPDKSLDYLFTDEEEKFYTLNEAVRILVGLRDKYFPDNSLDYLYINKFKEDEE